MPALPEDKLDALTKRFDSIEAALASGPAAEEFVRLSKDMPSSSPSSGRSLPIASSLPTLPPPRNWPPTRIWPRWPRPMIAELKPRIELAESEIRVLLLPRDAADEKSVILEVRAGTGGDEAALFAGDLLRMYQRYADLHGLELPAARAKAPAKWAATRKSSPTSRAPASMRG